jgi:TRAP-type uncharacterized transport system substrate-binding protein
MKRSRNALVAVLVLTFSASVLAGCSGKSDTKNASDATPGRRRRTECRSQSGGRRPRHTGPLKSIFDTVCGATSGGSYFLICNAIADMLNSKYPEYFKASVQSTAGSAAILRALEKGEVEFGISQAGIARDARLGINSFKDEKCTSFSSVSYVFPTVMHLVARTKAG